MWGRQTGKSFTLAAWAVNRLITRPGRLVTILSNSLSNGMELNHKCAEIARMYGRIIEAIDVIPTERADNTGEPTGAENRSCIDVAEGKARAKAPRLRRAQTEAPRLQEWAADVAGSSGDTPAPAEVETFNYETRITINGHVGRIKILAANPRTARGFSGDLILDEFAFHENSTAIWEAAEPILSANPDFLCRIASTPNGRNNMFYRLMNDPDIPKRIVPRSEAWRQGLMIAHPVTREPITPEQARALALDKRAYDQNYECIFEASSCVLLTNELISQAEDPDVGVICDDAWSDAARGFLTQSTPRAQRAQREEEEAQAKAVRLQEVNSVLLPRNLYAGVDVGRTQDLTVITVVEKSGGMLLVRAILRLRNMRFPAQQELLEVVCRSPRFACAQIDMTGLGLGLYEYTRQRFGDRIRGLNFSSSIPLGAAGPGRTGMRTGRNGTNGFWRGADEGRNVRVPEALAMHLLDAYESKRIRHPADPLLRDDLRKPERLVSAEGKVSIAAARTKENHADHFWSLALAVHAAQTPASTWLHVPDGSARVRVPRRYLV